MASRTWLAVAMCCFVWFAYLKWFAPPPPVTAPTTTANAPQQSTTQPPPSAQDIPYFGQPVAGKPSLTVDANKTVVTLSSTGGKIYEVSVLDYLDSLKKDGKPILVQDPTTSPYNLGTFFSDKQLEGFGHGEYTQEKLEKGARFKKTVGGATLVKEYQLDQGLYLHDAEYRLTLPPGDKKDWGYLAIPLGAVNPKYDANLPLDSWEVVYSQNDSVKRIHADAFAKEAAVFQGQTQWLSFGNRYFASTLVNQSALNPDVVVTHSANFSGAYLRYPLVVKEGQREVVLKLKYFLGPKDTAYLNQVAGMKQLIDYGMFSFFAYPLLELLQFFYRFVHNYGIAIILLTILVRVLFYPLSRKSFQSMKQMQKLQPQLAVLKEKYKDDMQRFSQEQMALFKAHKVNPMGGCFPMLVQLPVFIALYAVLGNSIELFHAPFFGWIQDLSSKDPYYIYPILMGLSMFAQTKMTPSAGADPMQQKMMLFMPVIFTFVMLNLPSGLTLYIFVSTILGIAQQLAMKDKEPKVAVLPKVGGAPEKS